MTDTLWVANDGSYGTGAIAIVSTRSWTDRNWKDFEDASDDQKQELALEISGHFKALTI